jgi:hypothetical protein
MKNPPNMTPMVTPDPKTKPAARKMRRRFAAEISRKPVI